MVSPRLPGKLARIRGKNHLRFQIVGIGNHAKTRVIVGLQSSDIKIYRTDVVINMKRIHTLSAGACAVIVLLGLNGCSGMSTRDMNTAIGAGVGAVGGSALTGGSALGTVGGAAVGGVIGNQVGRGRR